MGYNLKLDFYNSCTFTISYAIQNKNSLFIVTLFFGITFSVIRASSMKGY